MDAIFVAGDVLDGEKIPEQARVRNATRHLRVVKLCFLREYFLRHSAKLASELQASSLKISHTRLFKSKRGSTVSN